MQSRMQRWRARLLAALVVAGLAPLAVVAPVGAATPSLTLRFEYLRAGAVNAHGGIDQAMASPALGDVTGDGRLDLVVGSMDGVLTVLDPTSGAVQRQVTVQADAMIQSAPLLVDLTGDGVRDVVVGTVRGLPGQSHLKAFDLVPQGGRLLFDKVDSGQAPLSGFFGTPAAGDIDGDGVAEIVATSLDHRLYAWELDGRTVPGFPLYTYDTTLSSPSLADVDGDGARDIVFGADMDHGQPLPPGGYLWVVRGNGQPHAGYPLRLSSEVIWSTPAVGDLDGDGDFDAVVGTGRNFNTAEQNRLFAVDLRSRAALPSFPRTMTGNTMGSPALANLDADPQLEIITTTGDGNVHRVEVSGAGAWTSCAMPGWQGCGRDTAYIGSPVIADVDSDATPEVVVVGNRELLVFSATGAEEYRSTIRSNPGDYAWIGANAPAVANAGSTTYISAYVQVDNGDNRRANGDRVGIYTWSSPIAPASLPWPQFQRNVERTGSTDDSRPVDLPRYVEAVYLDLLGRPADQGGRDYWVGRIRAGLSRVGFTQAMARSPEWTQHVIDDLYVQVFGRPADDGGRRYWADLVARGMPVSDVASNLYGSQEWFHRSPPTGGGGTASGFVDGLYRRVLGREPDGGRTGWIAEVNRGVSRVAVSRAFYLSYESNGRRVDALYWALLNRGSDPGGRDYWARQLATMDDIVLAALLTASDEYFRSNG